MKRYILYYLFWEDRENNPMSEEKRRKIRKKLKNLQKYKTYSKVNPS